MARSDTQGTKRRALRFLAVVGLVVGGAIFAAPFLLGPETMTPEDVQSLTGLGGALLGVAVVFGIGSFLIRDGRG
ncbi:hypothetical protein [Pseudoroseicyclus aestuarii]|uniref:Uncharacterized protein n=1 Tax=Pseudoroseicyclus aestuarii TaxID=1795041 RepID=A0A318T379_9RHOB|nr:hypothetical protein [Pseudoroseicyclus aestuarii]PYE84664.1 hypothetical protein DFP88_102467 [Pseudoroseicyclus aestuarii]